MVRQNYYKERATRRRREVDAGLVAQVVKRERQVQPRLGTRKLYSMLKPEFEEAGVGFGRDRMFEILRDHDLLLDPLPKSPRTTYSRHSLPVFKNLIADLEATAPNQIWVSDITYVRTAEGYEFLSLIMDRFSRNIVGYHSGATLAATGTIAALDKALADLPEDRYPIHHSDRGSQYCCHEYASRLLERSISVSMTEENHCYENGAAERLNGTLKREYGLRMKFRTRAQARDAAAQAVWLYNNRRPHLALSMKTPASVHRAAA